MFDHDNFINAACQSIFGRKTIYKPEERKVKPFDISGDFHESFIDINLKTNEVDISSAKIVLFVRLVEFPKDYKEPKQGDFVIVDDLKYQVIDIEAHIPGSKKLILQEAEDE